MSSICRSWCRATLKGHRVLTARWSPLWCQPCGRFSRRRCVRFCRRYSIHRSVVLVRCSVAGFDMFSCSRESLGKGPSTSDLSPPLLGWYFGALRPPRNTALITPTRRHQQRFLGVGSLLLSRHRRHSSCRCKGLPPSLPRSLLPLLALLFVSV